MKVSSHPKPIAQRGGLWVAIVAVLTQSGCATYKPTGHSPNEAAEVRGSVQPIIEGEQATEPWRIALVRVDGRRISFKNQRCTETLLVDPGVRVLSVRAQSPRTTLANNGQVELTATLQPGHAYQLQFEWRPGLMTFWVEAVATHTEVSLRQWLSPAVPQYSTQRPIGENLWQLISLSGFLNFAR